MTKLPVLLYMKVQKLSTYDTLLQSKDGGTLKNWSHVSKNIGRKKNGVKCCTKITFFNKWENHFWNVSTTYIIPVCDVTVVQKNKDLGVKPRQAMCIAVLWEFKRKM